MPNDMITQANTPRIDLAAALEPSALAVWLEHEYAAHVAHAASLTTVYERFLVATADGIKDDEVTGRATDFARQLKAAQKDIDDTRKRIKDPVLHAQRMIDGSAKKLTDQLTAATGVVENRIGTYLRDKAEQERRARETEAARLAAEAEAKITEAQFTPTESATHDAAIDALGAAQQAEQLAIAPLPDLTRTRSLNGGLAGLKDNWVYATVDLSKVPTHLLTINDAAVKLAIKQGTREIPGLRIWNDAKAYVR